MPNLVWQLRRCAFRAVRPRNRMTSVGGLGGSSSSSLTAAIKANQAMINNVFRIGHRGGRSLGHQLLAATRRSCERRMQRPVPEQERSVRQRILIPPCGGSNPPIPATNPSDSASYFWFWAIAGIATEFPQVSFRAIPTTPTRDAKRQG